MSRTGDWCGNSVNLASRVTDEAPPGTVLVDESAGEVIDDTDIVWAEHGRRHLKGVRNEVQLYRAMRAGAG
jgi:adenylate cyclase